MERREVGCGRSGRRAPAGLGACPVWALHRRPGARAKAGERGAAEEWEAKKEMPTATKFSENMARHMPREEREARQAAEREALPQRKRLKLKKPGFISGNKTANGYWNQILRRMEGLVLLDDLDSEMLAGYCAMLARRDQTIALIGQLMAALGVDDAMGTGSKQGRKAAELTDQEWEASARAEVAGLTPEELIDAVSKLGTLNGKLQAMERTLLQYADKLGLTPAGRVRLAQKRAQAAAEPEPDGDLFGD